jgi:hypothetical protein
MRADMGKVLVERPRLGGDRRARKGYRKRAAKGLAAGDAPAREGMKARTGGTKHFNEHLGPLRRFLDANVGRPWDKVYAEISAHIDSGNVVQKHVLTHLFQCVATKTLEIDGKPFDAVLRRGSVGGPDGSLRTSHSRYSWYVCPRSGLLRKSRYVPWDWRPKPQKLLRRVRVSPTEVCLELADGWELVTLRPLPDPVPDRPRFDVVRQRRVGAEADHEARQLYGLDAYATARRRLSRAEQKQLPIPIDWVK